jgi:pentatricopeptide repeat protein
MQAAPADAQEHITKAQTEVTRRIQALGRQGKPKEAINELTNLARMGIKPDLIAATALISACTANRNMDMAMNVFDELFGVARPFCISVRETCSIAHQTCNVCWFYPVELIQVFFPRHIYCHCPSAPAASVCSGAG